MGIDAPDAAPPLPELTPEMLAVLDLLPDPVTLSRDGVILFANLQAVPATGAASREHLIGRTLQELVVPEERPVIGERVHRQQSGHRLPAIEYRGITLDGRKVTVEVHVQPVLYEGRPGMLALVRDITERRRMEEELRRSQKLDAVGQMAAGVAHEFNGLLLVIRGYLDLLLSGDAGAEERDDLVRQACSATMRASALVRRLLAFSRMQVHRPEVLSPNELVRGFLPMLARVLGDGLVLAQDLQDDAPLVEADASSLEQVLLNLVLNARDAMPRGGQIRVGTGVAEVGDGHPDGLAAGSYATLSVSDEGEGMDEETAARATEPFFTTKGSGRGTGLGLSTVSEVLRQHRGALTFSTRPGAGTCATVWLPAAPTAGRESAPPPPRASETILLVDDEPALRHMLRRGLAGHGYGILEAGSAEEALEILASRGRDVHVILTDVVMGGMCGMDLARCVYADWPGLPVILMTGYAERLSEWPGTPPPLLLKPFSLLELTTLLRKVLDPIPTP